MAKGSEPDIADVIETAYEETFRSLVFHPTPDDIEVTARAVTVRIALDVPDGVSEVLRADPLVADPLGRFSAYLRARLAGQAVTVEVVTDCLSEDETAAWRRLELALVEQAKRPDLFARLRALR